MVKNNVKQMFQQAQAFRNGNKIITLGNEKNTIPVTPQITNETLMQAFAIIDTHTRYIDNQNIINNLNIAINIISNIILSQHTDWCINEHRFIELVNEYLPLFTSDASDEAQEKIAQCIKDYIVYSCLIYFAVYHKDKELIKEYNSKISEAITEIIRFARNTAPVSSDTKSIN